MDITATDKYVKFGSKRVPKGSASYTSYQGGIVVMTLPMVGEKPFRIELSDITINGEAVTELSELTTFLDANLFKAGGGDGTTVGVADITGLEAGNLIVGGSDGNEQRKLLPADLDMLQNVNQVPVANIGSDPNANNWTGVPFSTSPAINSSMARRTNYGALQAKPAQVDDDTIPLSQFKGIVNNTLTNAETSASLQALYASAVVGTVVTSATALTEYRKISPTQWAKSAITIV